MRQRFTILVACAAVWLARAAPGQTNIVKPAPLGVVIQKEDLPQFAEDIYRALVTVGTNKFAFLVPEGFRLNNNPTEGSIKLINRDGNCRITFTILGPLPESGGVDPGLCRTLLLEQHPGAKVVQEFCRGVEGQNGPGYDLHWRGPGGVLQSVRTLFVPSALGMLQFVAVSTPANEKSMRDSISRMYDTFWISKDGKFEVIHPFAGS